MRQLIALCLFVSSAWLTPAGSAQIENGGFEEPDLQHWTVDIGQVWQGAPVNRPLAYVAPVGNAEGVPPLEGSRSALIVATSNYGGFPVGNVNCATDTFNVRFCPYPPPGMPGSALQGGPVLSHPLIVPQYYVGSIGQDFTGTTGEQLVWEWEPFGALWQGGGHPFAEITNGSDYLLLVAYGGTWSYRQRIGGQMNLVSSGTVDDGLWGDWSFTIPSDGVWTAYFGAIQHSDGYFTGGFVLDNVGLRVPEGPIVALLFAGLLAMAGRVRSSVRPAP